MSIVERNISYTTSRPDVVNLVPQMARYVLDVGCSNGALGRILGNLAPDRTVCGIEVNTAFAVEADKYLDYVVNADLNTLDWNEALGDRRFDCIIFADVLEHLVDPERIVEKSLSFLLPGGSIVLSLPNIRHISAFWAIYVRGRFPRRDRGIFDRTHLHWFSVRDAQHLLTQRSLTVSAMTTALRWGDHGGGRMNRLLNRLPRRVQVWMPVREFLTYQVCLRAESLP